VRSSPKDPFPGVRSTPTPSARSASSMRDESAECSGDWSRLGESASADRISSRLVSDLDPGTSTVASSGTETVGAS
jgi:hypothetical protein